MGFDGFGAPLPGGTLRIQVGDKLSSFFLCGKFCCWAPPATITRSLTSELSSAAQSVPKVASEGPKFNAFGLAIPRFGLAAATSKGAWTKSSAKRRLAREIERNIRKSQRIVGKIPWIWISLVKVRPYGPTLLEQLSIFRINAYVDTNQGLSIDVSRVWKSMRELYKYTLDNTKSLWRTGLFGEKHAHTLLFRRFSFSW